MKMTDPKYIRIFSDIHLDFDVPKNMKKFKPNTDIWTPPAMPTDKETILILAGDIWHAKKPFNFMGFSWFKKVSALFHSVLVVLGNHDFWGGNLQKEYENYRKNIEDQNLDNVFLVQNNTVIIGHNKFLGGTLWTDYNGGNPLGMQLAENQMNDFRFIRNGDGFSKLKASHLLGSHISTVRYIEGNAKKDYPEQNVWVLTHHLPTFKSIPSPYRSNMKTHENSMYASDLEYLFSEDITAWVHGHGHERVYLSINGMKVIANPRGYRGEDTGYAPFTLYDFKGNIL